MELAAVSLDREQQRERAFATYVLPEVPLLLRVAKSRTRTTSDAEDLVQDTLLRAYQAIDRFDGAYPRAWLLTILRNQHINNARRRRPELLHDSEASLDRLEASEKTGWSNPEATVVDAPFDTIVAEALALLAPRYRDVVRLVDIDGLTYAEAATVLGIPVGTVMSRLHRARTRLRNRLESAGMTRRRTA